MSDDNIGNKGKVYFLKDPKFQLLKQYQRAIFESTELSPSVRKLINELITEENLEKVKEKYVTMCNN